jgi:hypothetical protein
MNLLVALLELLVVRLKSFNGKAVDTANGFDEANAAELTRKAKEEYDKRELAHYAATVAAWYSTKMEHDKSLLTLAAAAIGVLITLVTKFPVGSYWEMSLFASSLLTFIVCLIAVLAIYKRNSTHLENLIHHDERSDRWLTVLDWMSLISFVSGIILASALGILLAVDSFKETNVAGNEKKGPIMSNDSVNRAISTRPVAIHPLSKSFNQAANMKPQASTTRPLPPAQQPAPTTSSPTGGNSVKKP